jgi:hypothetical protein
MKSGLKTGEKKVQPELGDTLSNTAHQLPRNFNRCDGQQKIARQRETNSWMHGTSEAPQKLIPGIDPVPAARYKSFERQAHEIFFDDVHFFRFMDGKYKKLRQRNQLKPGGTKVRQVRQPCWYALAQPKQEKVKKKGKSFCVCHRIFHDPSKIRHFFKENVKIVANFAT